MAGRDLNRGRLLLYDTITVTLTRPASRVGGAAASVTVANVQEQHATQDDQDHPMGGAFHGTTRTFHLWLVECQAMPPWHDYEITKQDGSVWIIKAVEKLAHGRRFRCHCLQAERSAP